MISRSFLRLCALEALRPSALLTADAPAWPTLAGTAVFDSRLDAIEDLQDGAHRPVIVVYTDDDNLDRIAQAGPQFYKNTLDLVFEISVIARHDEGDQYVAGYAFADAELEADLDLLEYQIYFALHNGDTGRLFRQLAKLPFVDWHSHQNRSGEESERIAKRTIRAKVSLHESCAAVPHTTPVGFDRLPKPLKAIAEGLAGSTYLANLARGIANAAPVLPTKTPLETVAARVDVGDPPAAEMPGATPDIAVEANNLQS